MPVGDGTAVDAVVRVELFDLTYAVTPRPRFANAAQIWLWLSPLKSTRSASRIASRASTIVGPGTESFIPSITSRRVRLRPSVSPN